MTSPRLLTAGIGAALLLASAGCGDDETEVEGESPATEVEAPDGAPGSPGADGSLAADHLISCLEDADLEASEDAGPPPRIDVSGEGSGAVLYYADTEVAAEATRQLTDELTGSGEVLTGAAGTVTYYYVGANEEAVAVQECLAP